MTDCQSEAFLKAPRVVLIRPADELLAALKASHHPGEHLVLRQEFIMKCDDIFHSSDVAGPRVVLYFMFYNH